VGGGVVVGNNDIAGVGVVPWQAVSRIKHPIKSFFITSYKTWPDAALFQTKDSLMTQMPGILIAGHLLSGDGENRTRVRKIRPPKIYERSWSKLVIAEASSN